MVPRSAISIVIVGSLSLPALARVKRMDSGLEFIAKPLLMLFVEVPVTPMFSGDRRWR